MDFPIPDVLDLERSLAAPYLPGMQRGEQVILKAWLTREGPRFAGFGFNVRVGVGVSAPDGASESAARFVLKTTQKRIDVVAFKTASVELYEVKIQANLGALGQMLGYRHLWLKSFPTWGVDSAGIICHLIAPDTGSVYAAHGMPFYVEADIVLPPLTVVAPAE